MRFKIFKFKSVTSTNDVAINMIREEKKEIGCVYADKQTKGRGTHGNKWVSDKGNLFGSLFFPLKDRYPPFNEFSIINSILVSNVIKNFCKKQKINLKFPNDIFVNKKKICGILQEHIIINTKKFLIIGIGINIVSNPNTKNKYQSTNILLETNKKPKIKEILDLIVASYEDFFIDLNSYNYKYFKEKADLMALN
ncbi:MAG: biotin--[acetyl-CoA-carboxylase] ligase [Candidatus Pelagibacterales bacterium]|nr:MAG: biotin--[acetyl-CoA-carboxylase] ligase [Pelagibacterales bacterium]